jgi:glycine cleavage system H protein
MAFIEKFLGKRVEIPEDRRYFTKQGLWAKSDIQDILFGLSQPSLVLLNGMNDLEWLVSDGKEVKTGDAVIFAITGKILYIEAPVGGVIHFNPEVKEDPSLASKDPYDQGWLFRIKPNQTTEHAFNKFVSAEEYAASLKGTEGFKNPEGLKGGVSGICKAVYTGIRDQKL